MATKKEMLELLEDVACTAHDCPLAPKATGQAWGCLCFAHHMRREEVEKALATLVRQLVERLPEDE